MEKENITLKRRKTAATPAQLAERLSPHSALGSWHHISNSATLFEAVRDLKEYLSRRYPPLPTSRERQWQDRIVSLLTQAAGLLCYCIPNSEKPCQHQKNLQRPLHALLVALHGVPNAPHTFLPSSSKRNTLRYSRVLNWTQLITAVRELQAALKGTRLDKTPAYNLAKTDWNNLAYAFTPHIHSIPWSQLLCAHPENLSALATTPPPKKTTEKSKTNPAQKEPMTATKAKTPRKTAAKKAPTKSVVSALSEEQFFRLLHSGAIILSIDSTSTETLYINIKDPLKALGIGTGAPTVSPATKAANPLIKATRNHLAPLPPDLLSHPFFEDTTAYDTFLEQQSALAFEAYVLAAKTPRQTTSNAFSAWMTAQYKLVLKQELAPVTGTQIMSLSAADKRTATALFDLVSNPN